MKVFLDTNIALDFILEREGFVDDAKKIIAYCLNCQYPLCLSSISFANISYVARKGYGGKNIREILSLVRKMVIVTTSNEQVVDEALKANNKDFEDAMQYYSAFTIGADIIITRNVQDFPIGMIKIMNPKDFLELVS